MIQKELKQLIDKYCMGVVPTDAQQDEIFDMVAELGADPQEVADYMQKMQNGPTREEVEAKKKMLEEKRKKEELAAKQKAENLAKQKAEEEERKEAKTEAGGVSCFKIIFLACLIGLVFVLKNKYDNDNGNNETTLYVVTIEGKRGYCDKTGQVVIPCKYDKAFNFHEGLALVVKSKKGVYIDKTGREVAPFIMTNKLQKNI